MSNNGITWRSPGLSVSVSQSQAGSKPDPMLCLEEHCGVLDDI